MLHIDAVAVSEGCGGGISCTGDRRGGDPPAGDLDGAPGRHLRAGEACSGEETRSA